MIGKQSLLILEGYPSLEGWLCFVFEGFGMTLALEASMKKRGGFRILLARAFFGITLVYVLFGFFGYMAYGDQTMDIITLNLPHNWSSIDVQAAALAFYILSAIFFDSFVIIFVVTILLAALDFWVVKNASGRIVVGLRWWNEINDLGKSVWKFKCLDQESIQWINKKDSWLFWWTIYLTVVATSTLFSIILKEIT